MPNAAEHIKKKLPSMYHQFKQLADIDITKEAMEVGPTTHYIMGGVRVDGDTQMSSVPGLFAAGEVAAGLHGANRLGGNSLSDLLVFGKRAGTHAATFAKGHGAGQVNRRRWRRRPAGRWRRSTAGAPANRLIRCRPTCRTDAGSRRASCATESEMRRALDVVAELRQRAARVGVSGNREYNGGWHTALDLANLLTVSEAITRAAIERKESRGGHFRDDYPEKADAFGKLNIIVRKGRDGEMSIVRQPIPEMPAELKQIIEENR